MEASREFYDLCRAVLQAPAYHLGFEAFLLLVVFWFLFHKSYKLKRTELTEEEKELLITEWMPESLVSEVTNKHHSLQPRTVTGKAGRVIAIDGLSCLNAVTHNYLGLGDHPKLEEVALNCLKKYGVGSCGPRGFYGTVDIHTELEMRLAKFMEVEEAVLYSYGFCTISSAIPAYAKHGDIIFCDEGVNFAIQKGLVGSRSQILFFKHNDMEDLEHILSKQSDLDLANPKKASVTRRFLIVEGVYMNYGDLCPLPELVKLKRKYKVRLFIDESCSFGVLGKAGKGISEHFGINIDEIDLISANLESAIPGYGGFCCGTSFVLDHQRLSGLGYCFSASLPPLQAGVAIASLDMLQCHPELLSKLKKNCEVMHDKILRIPKIVTSSDRISPVKHLYLNSSGKVADAESVLQKIVSYAMNKEVALSIARYIDREEHKLPPASIRLTVSASFSQGDIDKVVSVLNDAFQKFS